MNSINIPKLRSPGVYTPGFRVPLPNFNKYQSPYITDAKILTDPLMNMTVRHKYQDKVQNILTESIGRMEGGLIGAGTGAYAGTVIGSIVALVATGGAAIPVGAALGAKIGASIGALIGATTSDYTTYYATNELLRNTRDAFKINAGIGVLNTLGTVGKTMDIAGGGEAIRASLYSLVKNEDPIDNIMQAYGLHSSGRKEFDTEVIRKELGVDLGKVGNFTIDALGDLVTDPGFVSNWAAVFSTKSATKATTNVAKESLKDLTNNIDNTVTILKDISQNETLSKQFGRAILTEDKQSILKMIAQNTPEGIDLDGSVVQKTVYKLIKDVNNKALEKTSVKVYKFFKSIDNIDDFLTARCFDILMPEVAVIKNGYINRTTKMLLNKAFGDSDKFNRFKYIVLGNRANYNYSEEIVDKVKETRNKDFEKFVNKNYKNSSEPLIEGDDYTKAQFWEDYKNRKNILKKAESERTIEETNLLNEINKTLSDKEKLVQTKLSEIKAKQNEALDEFSKLFDEDGEPLRVSELNEEELAELSRKKLEISLKMSALSSQANNYDFIIQSIHSNSAMFDFKDLINNMQRTVALVKVNENDVKLNELLNKQVKELISLVKNNPELADELFDNSRYYYLMNYISKNYNGLLQESLDEVLEKDTIINTLQKEVKDSKRTKDIVKKLKKKESEILTDDQYKEYYQKSKDKSLSIEEQNKYKDLIELSDKRIKEYNRYIDKLETHANDIINKHKADIYLYNTFRTTVDKEQIYTGSIYQFDRIVKTDTSYIDSHRAFIKASEQFEQMLKNHNNKSNAVYKAISKYQKYLYNETLINSSPEVAALYNISKFINKKKDLFNGERRAKHYNKKATIHANNGIIYSNEMIDDMLLYNDKRIANLQQKISTANNSKSKKIYQHQLNEYTKIANDLKVARKANDDFINTGKELRDPFKYINMSKDNRDKIVAYTMSNYHTYDEMYNGSLGILESMSKGHLRLQERVEFKNYMNILSRHYSEINEKIASGEVDKYMYTVKKLYSQAINVCNEYYKNATSNNAGLLIKLRDCEKKITGYMRAISGLTTMVEQYNMLDNIKADLYYNKRILLKKIKDINTDLNDLGFKDNALSCYYLLDRYTVIDKFIEIKDSKLSNFDKQSYIKDYITSIINSQINDKDKQELYNVLRTIKNRPIELLDSVINAKAYFDEVQKIDNDIPSMSDIAKTFKDFLDGDINVSDVETKHIFREAAKGLIYNINDAIEEALNGSGNFIDVIKNKLNTLKQIIPYIDNDNKSIASVYIQIFDSILNKNNLSANDMIILQKQLNNIEVYADFAIDLDKSINNSDLLTFKLKDNGNISIMFDDKDISGYFKNNNIFDKDKFYNYLKDNNFADPDKYFNETIIDNNNTINPNSTNVTNILNSIANFENTSGINFSPKNNVVLKRFKGSTKNPKYRIVIDTETSNANNISGHKAQIIQFTYDKIDITTGKSIDKGSYYLDPDYLDIDSWDISSEEVHKITQDSLKIHKANGKTKTPEQFKELFLGMSDEETMIMAHNGNSFDFPVIYDNWFNDGDSVFENGKLNKEAFDKLYESTGKEFNLIDTYPMAKTFIGSDYRGLFNNHALAIKYGVDVSEFTNETFDNTNPNHTKGLCIFFNNGEEEYYYNGKPLHDAETDVQLTNYFTEIMLQDVMSKKVNKDISLYDFINDPINYAGKSTVRSIYNILGNSFNGNQVNTFRLIRILKYILNCPTNKMTYEDIIDVLDSDYYKQQIVSYILSGGYDENIPLDNKLIKMSLFGNTKSTVLNINDILSTDYTVTESDQKIIDILNELSYIKDQATKKRDKLINDREAIANIVLGKQNVGYKQVNRNYVRMQLVQRILTSNSLRTIADVVLGNSNNFAFGTHNHTMSNILNIIAKFNSADSAKIKEAQGFFNNLYETVMWEDNILGKLDPKTNEIDLFYRMLWKTQELKNKGIKDLDIVEKELRLLQFNSSKLYSKGSVIPEYLLSEILNKYESIMDDDFLYIDNANNISNRLYRYYKENILDQITTNFDELKEAAKKAGVEGVSDEAYNSLKTEFNAALGDFRSILTDTKHQNQIFRNEPFNIHEFVAENGIRPFELPAMNSDVVIKYSKEYKQNRNTKSLANNIFSRYYKGFEGSPISVDFYNTPRGNVLSYIAKSLKMDLNDMLYLSQNINDEKYSQYYDMLWNQLLTSDNNMKDNVIKLNAMINQISKADYIKDQEGFSNTLRMIFLKNYVENMELTKETHVDNYFNIKNNFIKNSGFDKTDYLNKLNNRDSVDAYTAFESAKKNYEAYNESCNLFNNLKKIYQNDPIGLEQFFKDRRDQVLLYLDQDMQYKKIAPTKDNLEKVLLSSNGKFTIMSNDDYIKLVSKTQKIVLPPWLEAMHKYFILPSKLFSLYFSLPFMIKNISTAYMQNMAANGNRPINTISNLLDTAKEYHKWKLLYTQMTTNKSIYNIYSDINHLDMDWIKVIESGKDSEFYKLISKEDGFNELKKFIETATKEDISKLKAMNDIFKTNAAFSEITDIQRNLAINKKKQESLDKLRNAKEGTPEYDQYYVYNDAANKGFDSLEDELNYLKSLKNKTGLQHYREHMLVNIVHNKNDKYNNFMKKAQEYSFMKQWLNINEDIEIVFRAAMMRQQMDTGVEISQAAQKVMDTHFIYNDKSIGERFAEVFIPFISYPIKAAKCFSNLTSDASFIKTMYVWNKYNWGDEDPTRSDYLMKRKASGDIPIGDRLFGLGNGFTESLSALANPIEAANNKLNPIAKPFVDLATNAKYNRVGQMTGPMYGVIRSVQELNNSGQMHAGTLLNTSNAYIRYQQNYNKNLYKNYPQKSYLYNSLYTRNGYSRVSMRMQQTTLNNLQYRVGEVIYNSTHRR